MTTKKETPPLHWLVGTWRSDKKRTIAGWGKYPPGSVAFRKMMLRELGKLTFKYTAKRCTSMFDDSFTTVPYRVVWQSPTCVFVVSGRKDQESGQLINFESPSVYWVHVGRFVEYFTKIESPNKSLNTGRGKKRRAG